MSFRYGAVVLVPWLAGCGLILDTDPEQSTGAGGMDGSRPTVDGGGPVDDARRPHPDAARGDAGPDCVAVPEACNRIDDDCDGFTDENFDLSIDPDHCGDCETGCASDPTGLGVCTDGMCGLACRIGYMDCDGDGDCDSLGTPMNCGVCGTTCSPTQTCRTAGAGGVSYCSTDCPEPYVVCGGACVDVTRDPLNCGDCTAACTPAHASSMCVDGVCAIDACDPGYRNCNGLATDGCEADTDIDPNNCGMCGRTCGASACRGGACVAASGCLAPCVDCGGGSCVDPFYDPFNCTGCGIACASMEVCCDGTCASGCPAGILPRC